MKTKKCTGKYGCGKELPIDNFYFRENIQIYDNKCLECNKKYKEQYYQKNKKRLSEKNKQKYKKNRKYRLEQRAIYRENNIIKIREKDKKDKQMFANFYSYAEKISYAEEIRRDPNNQELLHVRCTYCNNWFNPTNANVQHRLQSLEGKISSVNFFYCSAECKKLCPSYNVVKIPKTHKKIKRADGTTKIVPKKSSERNFYPNEVNPEFRKMVFERDNWRCQNCGKSKLYQPDLIIHCHHIIPRKLEPIFESDLDNGITLCKECHKEIHKIKGLRYIDLAQCNI